MAGMGNGNNNTLGGLSTGKGLLSNVDQSTVIHAAVIALIIVVAYHFLFQR